MFYRELAALLGSGVALVPALDVILQAPELDRARTRVAAARDAVREGRPVAVFPEGRTRGGHEVGPFHARIFQAAVEAQVPVQPVALRYGAGGAAQTVVAFGPRENFAQNFLRLLGERARIAEVHFLEPIMAGEVDGRRRIAELSRERIVAAMES